MHIVIIGNGVAGITAARHIRKQSNHAITVISAESEHFFSRTALMYIYMGHMRYEHTKPYEDWFWVKNRIDLVRDYVNAIDTERQCVCFPSGKTLHYDKLLVATGSVPRMPGVPGEHLRGVQGLYSLQDLAMMEEYTRNIDHAVIVGGGLIGVETAEMLHSRHIPTTFLVREREYWNTVLPDEEAAMISRHIRSHGIDLRLQTELSAILGDSNDRVRAVLTKSGEEIPCQFLALTIGVVPNIAIVKNSGIPCERGVLVNESFETSVPNVYAIGDCAEIVANDGSHLRRVEPLWYAGRAHGEVVAQVICGNKQVYKRGVFFNSAKFFDIEYQTYGTVKPTLPPNERSLYWEHPNGRHSIRITYRNDEGSGNAVTGFLVLGVRYRQAACERWIASASSIEEVLTNLGAANFDPEFFPQFEHHLVEAYNRQAGTNGRTLTLQQRRGSWRTVAKKLTPSSISV